MKKIVQLSVFLAIFGTLLISCDADQTPYSPEGSDYRVDATLRKNLSDGSARFDLFLTKDGECYVDADVTLNGISLETYVCGYSKQFLPSQISVDTSYTLSITDSTDLDVEFTVTLPPDISIDSAGHRFYTGAPESVSWSSTAGADGFILATSPPADTIAYDGYEEYFGLTETTGAIPPETFLDDGNRIVGTHMIYVAAYNGAPVEFPTLPFDLPSVDGPADNVSHSKVKGRIAGLVIAAPDSIIVDTE